MAFFTGTHGSLELEGAKIAAVQNWSFTVNVQTADSSTLGATDTTIVPVRRTTTGSCRILYYQEVLGVKSGIDSASRFINKVSIARTAGEIGAPLNQNGDEIFTTLQLKVDDGSVEAGGGVSGRHIEMRILITSLTLTMSVGEILAADIQFQNNGAIKGLDL